MISRHKCLSCGKTFEFDLAKMSAQDAFQIGFDHAWHEHPETIEAVFTKGAGGKQ